MSQVVNKSNLKHKMAYFILNYSISKIKFSGIINFIFFVTNIQLNKSNRMKLTLLIYWSTK